MANNHTVPDHPAIPFRYKDIYSVKKLLRYYSKSISAPRTHDNLKIRSLLTPNSQAQDYGQMGR